MVSLSFNINTKTLREINKLDTASKITGKTEQEAKKIIQEVYRFNKLSFDIKDPLMIQKNRLPFFKKNIMINILGE
jgi:hypothetical protein